MSTDIAGRPTFQLGAPRKSRESEPLLNPETLTKIVRPISGPHYTTKAL